MTTAHEIAINCNHCENLDDTCGECTIKMWKAAEAERDEANRQLSEAQTAIDAMAQIVGSADTVRHQLEQARSDIEDYRAEIERLTRKAEQAQHALITACNKTDDDVTRLSWLQSLITSALPFIETISGGDVNAGMMCISEVQSLHDDLQKLVSGMATA